MFEGRTGFRGLGVKKEEKTGRGFIFFYMRPCRNWAGLRKNSAPGAGHTKHPGAECNPEGHSAPG